MNNCLLNEWNELKKQVIASMKNEESIFKNSFLILANGNWDSWSYCNKGIPYKYLYQSIMSNNMIKYLSDLKNNKVPIGTLFSTKKIHGPNRNRINKNLLKFNLLTNFINNKKHKFIFEINERVTITINNKKCYCEIVNLYPDTMNCDLRINSNIENFKFGDIIKNVSLDCIRQTNLEYNWEQIRDSMLGKLSDTFLCQNMDFNFNKILKSNKSKNKIYQILYDLVMNNSYENGKELIMKHKLRSELIDLFNIKMKPKNRIEKMIRFHGGSKLYYDLSFATKPYEF